MIILDQYKGVTSWDFNAQNKDGWSLEDNNALFKYRFGNINFAVATLVLYSFLSTIFFAWDKVFKSDGLLCTLCQSISRSFRNLCAFSSSKESDPPSLRRKKCLAKDDEATIENQSPDNIVKNKENEN